MICAKGIDAFLDTYVRIDEGTGVLLCAHRSCARTAAQIFAAIFVRGTKPEVILFDHEEADTETEIRNTITTLRNRPGVRRVAIVVCEPVGPSFTKVLEQGQVSSTSPIFRVSGHPSM